ncbi:PREDICTED: putative SNAP25 homologous protein SNAP30 [Populus euphratica]|uniref:SNAP25 homologous protein SNAP30 n=1 Tax=Populus euphratica TaxID=75702 RepID=A0AAJ6TWH0_POPEU|nr:PREDICTED: putative SNAP25 homologous protein SNAP30 [Populus euphratica]XP_011018226.1 PREDICTED: putative SNAP25 homologous protein SNAP30 [Populus euphratica]
MFGFRKSPANNKPTKQSPVNPPASFTSNPFDSDDESNAKQALHHGKRTSSEPMLNVPSDAFDDREGYKNDFRDSGGLENQSVQELEKYATYKAEETTKSVTNCLRIAEDIRQDATRTLDMLHAQGEQITRTHNMAVDMDKDLGKGEKLLNNLGGIFSKPWKPKKTRDITGPLITADKPSKLNQYNRGEREKLGLAPRGHSAPITPPPEPSSALQKVEAEKGKQDDALSDLSNILGDLKGMAIDMGSELNRQNKSLDHLSDDVDELNSRVKGANQRARRLLGK